MGGGADYTPQDGLIEAWQESVDTFRPSFGHVYETARSRVRLAAVLRAAGKVAEAKVESEAAREIAERLGAQPLLRELRGLPGYDASVRRQSSESRRISLRGSEKC